MSHTIFQSLRAVQAAAMLALVAVFLRPHATWSVQARLPTAIIVFISSAVLLVHDLF